MADDLNNAEERIQALIRERNAARSDLQEARAEIASLTEQGTATKGATEAAVNAARAEMQSKITDLEGQVRRSSNRALLLEDKIPADGMDDLLEYLDYQYGRISVDEGATKPEFSDWYKEARKTNKVLRAAMKPSVAAGALEDSTEVKPEPKAAPKPVAKQNVVQPKPGETGREVVLSKVKMGTPEWNAAKDRLAKSAFTRG
jgi:deoxyribodipyrimidine photolyase